MISIDTREGLRKAYETYLAGELQAQKRSADDAVLCSYTDENGCKCVVGAMIPAPGITWLVDSGNNGESIVSLFEEERVTVRNFAGLKGCDNTDVIRPEVEEYFQRLQLCHDGMMRSAIGSNSRAKYQHDLGRYLKAGIDWLDGGPYPLNADW